MANWDLAATKVFGVIQLSMKHTTGSRILIDLNKRVIADEMLRSGMAFQALTLLRTEYQQTASADRSYKQAKLHNLLSSPSRSFATWVDEVGAAHSAATEAGCVFDQKTLNCAFILVLTSFDALKPGTFTWHKSNDAEDHDLPYYIHEAITYEAMVNHKRPANPSWTASGMMAES
jgi:hypothetical protein